MLFTSSGYAQGVSVTGVDTPAYITAFRDVGDVNSVTVGDTDTEFVIPIKMQCSYSYTVIGPKNSAFGVGLKAVYVEPSMVNGILGLQESVPRSWRV